jgi:hypothetical protein
MVYIQTEQFLKHRELGSQSVQFKESQHAGDFQNEEFEVGRLTNCRHFRKFETELCSPAGFFAVDLFFPHVISTYFFRLVMHL